MGAGQPWPGPTPRRDPLPGWDPLPVRDPLPAVLALHLLLCRMQNPKGSILGVLHAAQKECSANTAGQGGQVYILLAEGRTHPPPAVRWAGTEHHWKRCCPDSFPVMLGSTGRHRTGKHRTQQCRASDGQPATFSHGCPATSPPRLLTFALLSPPPRWMSTSRLWSHSGQPPHAAPSECTSTATNTPATRGARGSLTRLHGSTSMRDGEQSGRRVQGLESMVYMSGFRVQGLESRV